MIVRGRYHHDPKQWERDVLTSDRAQAEVRAHAETALSIFESIVPRDDNEWANSVTVDGGVKNTKDSKGRSGERAWASISSSDPNAKAKEFGHVIEARRRKGERAQKTGKFGPLRRGHVYRFVEGAHSMTKAMAAATDMGGQVRTRGRR